MSSALSNQKLLSTLLLPLLFFVFTAAPSFAEKPTANRDDVVRQLEEVNQKLKKEQARLDSLRKRLQEITAEKKKVEALLVKAKAKRDELLSAVEADKKKAEEFANAVVDVKKDVTARQNKLRRRLGALYRTRKRTAGIDYLAKSSSATEMLKRSHYFSLIAAHDSLRIDELSVLSSELRRKKNELEAVLKKKEARVAALEKVKKQLEQKEFEQAELLQQTAKQEKERKKALAKLEESARRLEKILAGIMGGQEPVPPPKVAPRKAVVEQPRPKSITYDPLPFKGLGLQKLRGKLPLPVDGQLVQRFGKQRHEEFSDILFVKGLEFHSEVGVKVKAVAQGKVIYNGALPGYRQVVILDHGKRYYTLYGRLNATLCQLGDVVEAGDVLAVLGEADPRGRNFYFELRLKGKAVDPTRYFKVKPVLADSAH